MEYCDLLGRVTLSNITTLRGHWIVFLVSFIANAEVVFADLILVQTLTVAPRFYVPFSPLSIRHNL